MGSGRKPGGTDELAEGRVDRAGRQIDDKPAELLPVIGREQEPALQLFDQPLGKLCSSPFVVSSVPNRKFVALTAVIPAKPAERARAGIHLFFKANGFPRTRE